MGKSYTEMVIRKRVLDELITWKGEFQEEMGYYPRHQDIWKKIEELRQGEQE